MNTLGKDIPCISRDITAAYEAGMRSERQFFIEMLSPIFAAFARAERDPQAKIPSPLMAAIESARSKFTWEPD